MKEESENGDFKLNIQKTKITASSPITSRQTKGKKWEVSDFIFLVFKINVYGGCSHEIRRILGRIAMMNQIVYSKVEISLCRQTSK